MSAPANWNNSHSLKFLHSIKFVIAMSLTEILDTTDTKPSSVSWKNDSAKLT